MVLRHDSWYCPIILHYSACVEGEEEAERNPTIHLDDMKRGEIKVM